MKESITFSLHHLCFYFLNRLSAYRARKTGADDVTGELIADLTKFEKTILLEQNVIEIRGKVCTTSVFVH